MSSTSNKPLEAADLASKMMLNARRLITPPAEVIRAGEAAATREAATTREASTVREMSSRPAVVREVPAVDAAEKLSPAGKLSPAAKARQIDHVVRSPLVEVDEDQADLESTRRSPRSTREAGESPADLPPLSATPRVGDARSHGGDTRPRVGDTRSPGGVAGIDGRVSGADDGAGWDDADAGSNGSNVAIDANANDRKSVSQRPVQSEKPMNARMPARAVRAKPETENQVAADFAVDPGKATCTLSVRVPRKLRAELNLLAMQARYGHADGPATVNDLVLQAVESFLADRRPSIRAA